MTAADRELAERHGVAFRVVSRPSGQSPRAALEAGLPYPLPNEDGSFSDPADAVALARSLVDRDVTVLADGNGAYWHSGEPDRIYSELLVRVCRDKVLGPEEAQREHDREHLRDTIQQLSAEQHLPVAVDIIKAATSADEAITALQQHPLELSARDARHLVLARRSFRCITTEGQREIVAAQVEAVQALDDLGPSLDVEL